MSESIMISSCQKTDVDTSTWPGVELDLISLPICSLFSCEGETWGEWKGMCCGGDSYYRVSALGCGMQMLLLPRLLFLNNPSFRRRQHCVQLFVCCCCRKQIKNINSIRLEA